MDLPQTVTKSNVRRLDDETLLDGWETLYERCLQAEQQALGELRRQLDLLSAEGTRRRLINWAA